MVNCTLALAATMTIVLLTPAVAQTSTQDPAPTPPTVAPSSAPAADTTTGSTGLGTTTRMLTVDALEDMDLVGVDGKEIGEIEGVVENNADKKQFVLVERGGFLGLGAKEIAIPAENIAVQGEKVTLRNMDVAQLDGLAEFNNEGNAYRELDGTQQISLSQQQ
jgi:sporulation protein YlmC with PRC-barrel domain